MNYGFVRVGAAVPLLKVGDCIYNIEQMKILISLAEKQAVQLLCFPELGITGYTCGDLFHQKILLEQAEAALSDLLSHSKTHSMLVAVGMPLTVQNRLMNVAVVFQSGHILGVVPKSWLPNYGEFYEKRWFSSAHEVQVTEVELCGQKAPFGTNLLFKNGSVVMAAELCEDLWMPIPPSSYHALNGANILFNLSASNELIAKNDYRKNLVAQQASKCIAAYVYTSSGFGESTTDVVFAGDAQIVENGVLLEASKRFSMDNQLVVSDVDVERLNGDRMRNTGFTLDLIRQETKDPYRIVPFTLATIESFTSKRHVAKHPFVPKGAELDKRCHEIFSIQIHGLSKRLVHTTCKQVVIGISGGLDSTLALLSAVMTYDKLGLPRNQIYGITMPGFGTTGRTYNNALTLMRALGVTVREISIVDAVNQHFKDLEHDPNLQNVVYENAQARERTQLLMDIANQVNGLVIGTGDLSELALGWATYNGDHMSMYGINAGIPKTLVRFLVEWASRELSGDDVVETLQDILATPVSPELLPGNDSGEIVQKTEDLVGPYELHDFFLYYMLRFGFKPSKIYWMAQQAFEDEFDDETILKWLKIFYKRFFSQQFKRSCLPDGPKVGSVSLSPRGDWRMPSDAVAQLWLNDLNTI